MRIHYILHAEFEKLGVIENWINENKHTATGTHTYQGETLPDVNNFDMLIIMGGPQSAVEYEKYPYLKDEIELTKQAIQANKIVLGICLGAQIIGLALGAKAEVSPYKEIGIYPITLHNNAQSDPLFSKFPNEFNVMHWHSDMPGLAQEAVLLAQSEGCPRQIFRYGDRVYGFQCHMELTEELINAMAEHCSEDLKPSPYVHSKADLLRLDLTTINQKMYMILDYLAGM